MKDGNLYIGRTNNFERRFKEHNLGKVQSTKSRTPLVLLEKHTVINEIESVLLEEEYKKGYKREVNLLKRLVSVWPRSQKQ